MQFDTPITLALSKGRIFRETLPLLAHAGITPADDPETSRKLILETNLIVDLVESGNTLKANGLEPLEHICDISSRLVVNKASWKMKHPSIMSLIGAMREAMDSRSATD
jgi:ATP phosphoribosyltransferase